MPSPKEGDGSTAADVAVVAADLAVVAEEENDDAEAGDWAGVRETREDEDEDDGGGCEIKGVAVTVSVGAIEAENDSSRDAEIVSA